MKRLSTLCLLAAGFFIPGQAQQARPTVLDSVYAPLKVATPPSDAYIGLSLLDNGETDTIIMENRLWQVLYICPVPIMV